MLVIGIILATSMSLCMYALTPSRQLASAQMRPESAKFRAAWILHHTDVNLFDWPAKENEGKDQVVNSYISHGHLPPILQTRRDAILGSRVAPFTNKQVVLVQDLWIYCLGASFASQPAVKCYMF